jgi:hypothetical protein
MSVLIKKSNESCIADVPLEVDSIKWCNENIVKAETKLLITV